MSEGSKEDRRRNKAEIEAKGKGEALLWFMVGNACESAGAA